MNTKRDDKLKGCYNCAHYYITHDAKFRHGCRALNFKSQKHPIAVVMEASGQQCHFFQEKRVGRE